MTGLRSFDGDLPGGHVTATPNVVCTQLGTFNTIPLPGQQIIPINNSGGAHGVAVLGE